MKLDTSKIAGYAEMTAEQKVAALEAADVDFGDGYVKKALLDKAASEAADWKHKFQATLTEQEQKAQQEAENLKKLQEERDDLFKQVSIGRYKTEFLAQGYSEEQANEAAEAMHAGDMTKVLAVQKAFLVDFGKKAEADALKGMKEPNGGNGGGADKTDPAIELAKQIGQAAYGNQKATSDVVNSYIINK